MKLEPQLSVVISFFRESNDSEKVALNLRDRISQTMYWDILKTMKKNYSQSL